MPVWSDAPPAGNDPVPFRLIRVPADKAVRAIVTCSDMIGATTHFVRNRTLPCGIEQPCPYCAEGHSYRWHAYLSIVLVDTYEHVILELTAAGSESLRNYAEAHLDIRGAFITAHRPNKKHNGRVIVAVRPGDPTRQRIPDPPDIRRILCHIWNVKYEPPINNRRSRPGARDVDLTKIGNPATN
jgi:hypothetical protein